MEKALRGFHGGYKALFREPEIFSTPHYFLANTGLQEGDFSAQLGYKWKGIDLSASCSQYNAKIGIFSGSEVGDTTDLAKAFDNRSYPFEPDVFTYKIDRGYQLLNHEVLKFGARHQFSNDGTLNLTYSRQRDLRQEFSSDVAYSSQQSVEDLPQDWFKLITHSIDLVYEEPYENNFSGSMGISGSTKGNVFEGQERQPLIPNYRDYGAGAFALQRYFTGKWTFEGGIRYDYLWRRVYEYDINTLGTYYSTFNYQNVTGTLGTTFDLNEHFSFDANFGIGWRPPSPEEMYINGVHSSTAQFMIGDSTLKSERSYQTTLSVHYQSQKLTIDADFYDNEINNFIYPNPIGTLQIVGVGYHAFQYVQDNVGLLGSDITVKWKPLAWLALTSKASLLRATNKTRDGGLINMPPARFQNKITIHGTQWGKLKRPYFSVENVSVLKQNYIVPEQEVLLPPPPPAYSIWNAGCGFMLPVGNKSLELNFSVTNLTNKVYSDYMDLFRYFAYEKGLDFAIRAKFSF